MTLLQHNPFDSNPTLAAAIGESLAITRATTGYTEDQFGWLREQFAGEARFPGASFSQNRFAQSDDLSDAAWSNINVNVSGGVTDPEGGSTAFTVTATSASGRVIQTAVATAGKLCYSSVWLRRRTGTGNISLLRGDGTLSPDLNITSEWQQYDFTPRIAASGDLSAVWITTSGDAVDVWHPQAEEVDGKWVSQNLTPRSNEFTAGNWTKTSVNLTTGYADPFGGNTATRVEATAGGARVYTFGPVGYRDRYTSSIWMRRVSGSGDVQIQGASTSYTVVNLTSEWQRFSTIEFTGGGRRWYVGVRLVTSGDVIEIYGGQVERSKPNDTGPTDYVEITDTTPITNYEPGTYVATTTVPLTVLSGGNRGLLYEAARTQLLTDTEDFTATAWTKTDAQVNGSVALAPDGSFSADRLLDGETSAFDRPAFMTQNVTGLTQSVDHTFSAFIRADQLTWVKVHAHNFVGPGNGGVFFNLLNGTIGTEETNFRGLIKDIGNGYYRCSIVFNPGADSSGAVRIYLADGDNDTTVPDDGTSSIIVWGTALEEGNKPSSYIPNRASSGTVTRNQDEIQAASLTGTTFEGAGTLYFRGEFEYDIGNQEQWLWTIRNTANTDLIRVRKNNGANTLSLIGTYVVGNGASVSGPGTISPDTEFSVVCRLATNDNQVALGGSVGTADTDCGQPSDIDLYSISRGSIPTDAAEGLLVKEVRWYNEGFDDTDLANASNDQFPSASSLYGMGFSGDFLYGP